MTLLVRNEADIVDAQIAYHLNAGVDLVIATDNRSEDGTTEILERYAHAGCLHLLHEDGDDMRQDEWVTRMARLAATEFEADWVIDSDADEFWWPRGGSLKEVLAAIPERYGIVRGCWRHFVPRPDDGEVFYERMTVRLTTPAPPGDMRTIFHAHQKIAHRGDPFVRVERGNHDVDGPGLEPLRAWHPIDVLHFSLRSSAQLERKSRGGWERSPDYVPAPHQRLLIEAGVEGRLDRFLDAFVVSDEALDAGLADGTLVLDTRLRDALRTLRKPEGGFRLPDDGTRLPFGPPDLGEAAAHAAEASMLVGVDGIVRAEERTEALEKRLELLEGRALRGVGATRRERRRLARR